MKKSVLAFALCCLAAGSLCAQNFNQTAPSAEALCSGDWTVVSAEGDLNKDGVKDLVAIAKGNYSWKGFAFYFGEKQGGYTLFRDYELQLTADEVKLSVSDKGVARIEVVLGSGADIFLFRYEGGDFRLIGGKKDRHKSSEDYDISYNYLTDKMIRTDGSGKSRKSTTLDMPKLPKIHFGWIPLDYDMLDYLVEEPDEEDPLGPEDVLVMGIFRVMQANEMLFWHFCDSENPYHNPRPADEGWYAEDEHMSPGSYNYYGSLTFTKRPDGSYLVDLTESTTDRSFESSIDWDAEDVELPEGAYEEEVTGTVWVFQNGKFTVESVREGGNEPEEATATASPVAR